MKIAIFCWRPYQVFSAINMVSNNIEETKDNTTLFLYNHANLPQLKDKLETLGLFNDIAIVEDYKGHSQYFRKILGLVFPQMALKRKVSIISEHVNRDSILKYNTFDKIIVTSFNTTMFEFLQLNPSAQIVLYEDGMFSYIFDEVLHALSYQYKRIKWLLKIRIHNFNIIAKYVYEPKLVIPDKYKLLALPKINDGTYDIQKKAFSYDHEAVLSQYKGKRIVYLDERFPVDRFKDGISEEEVFNIIKPYADETILRPHPGNEPGSMLFTVDKVNQSWELCCKDILNSDSIIITKTSTAAFTPFMLYGIQAHIIYLAELLFKNTEGVEMVPKNIINNMDYKKIYVPKNIDEFRQILNKIL